MAPPPIPVGVYVWRPSIPQLRKIPFTSSFVDVPYLPPYPCPVLVSSQPNRPSGTFQRGANMWKAPGRATASGAELKSAPRSRASSIVPNPVPQVEVPRGARGKMMPVAPTPPPGKAKGRGSQPHPGDTGETVRPDRWASKACRSLMRRGRPAGRSGPSGGANTPREDAGPIDLAGNE